MINRKQFLLTVAALTIAVAAPAMATQSVTSKTSTVNPDGSVSYESQTVVVKDPVPPVSVTTTTVVPTTSATVVTTTPTAVVGTGAVVPVTFYYYDPVKAHVVSVPDLSDSIFALWDEDHNDIIDMNEFYRNKMVMYEPVEYSKRTFQDIDADGDLELTQDEYTVRIQQLPTYSRLNTDNKAGISLYEFIGTGFQAADKDDNNNLSYKELHNAFYGQAYLTAGTGNYNGNK